jgi:hypothetical protein
VRVIVGLAVAVAVGTAVGVLVGGILVGVNVGVGVGVAALPSSINTAPHLATVLDGDEAGAILIESKPPAAVVSVFEESVAVTFAPLTTTD